MKRKIKRFIKIIFEDIKLSQVLEFNIMHFDGIDSEVIKQIYKRDK